MYTPPVGSSFEFTKESEKNHAKTIKATGRRLWAIGVSIQSLLSCNLSPMAYCKALIIFTELLVLRLLVMKHATA